MNRPEHAPADHPQLPARKIGVLICTRLPALIERWAITPEIGAVTRV